ncbi:MAG: hypothetical protein V4658_07940 [Bacteroidota bacterium]
MKKLSILQIILLPLTVFAQWTNHPGTPYKNALVEEKILSKHDTVNNCSVSYKNDTLVRKVYHNKESNHEFYLNETGDTIFEHSYYYKNDSVCIELGKGFITGFLLSDYMAKAETSIPPIPRYCMHKAYYISYFRRSDAATLPVIKQINRSDAAANLLFSLTDYDSLGNKVLEKWQTGPLEVSWHGFNYPGNECYHYKNGIRVVLKEAASVDYPSTFSEVMYQKGILFSRKVQTSFGEHYHIDSMLYYYPGGQLHEQRLSFHDTSCTKQFYISGWLRCTSSSFPDPSNPGSHIADDTCYDESGYIKSLVHDDEKGEMKICYYGNGQVAFRSLTKHQDGFEETKGFTEKGKASCLYRRKGNRIKIVQINDHGKKTVHRLKGERGDLGAVSPCRCPGD